MPHILYISYDGLTDPLGQSQILPYLGGLSDHGYRFTVVSLEKPAALQQQEKNIREITAQKNITWTVVNYDTGGGMKAKINNDRALKKAVKDTLYSNRADLIHARSYPASVIALKTGRRTGIPFVFDMRGFWADERVEGNIWDLRKTHHRLLYRYFKKKEKQLLQKSAQVISLTQAAKDYMTGHFAQLVTEDKITVIPCCADLDHFCLRGKNLTARSELGITAESPVLIYLGSVGTWYLLDEMVDFFKTFRQSRQDAVFLVVTPHDHEKVRMAFEKKGVQPDAYRITSAGRNEVPDYIACADAAVFFVRPSFSKTASSPVKLAELMGSGLPVFSNTGIGDMDLHARQTSELHLVTRLDTQAYAESIDAFEKQAHSPEKARAFALAHYSLKAGIDKYKSVYEKVLKNLNG